MSSFSRTRVLPIPNVGVGLGVIGVGKSVGGTGAGVSVAVAMGEGGGAAIGVSTTTGAGVVGMGTRPPGKPTSPLANTPITTTQITNTSNTAKARGSTRPDRRPVGWGLSIASDPYGRVLAQTDFFGSTDRTMVAQVPVKHVTTIYTLFGRYLEWLAPIGLTFLIIRALTARRQTI